MFIMKRPRPANKLGVREHLLTGGGKDVRYKSGGAGARSVRRPQDAASMAGPLLCIRPGRADAAFGAIRRGGAVPVPV